MFVKISRDAVGFLEVPEKGIIFEGIYRGYKMIPGEKEPYPGYMIESAKPLPLRGGGQSEPGDWVIVSGAAMAALGDVAEGTRVKIEMGAMERRGARQWRPGAVYEWKEPRKNGPGEPAPAAGEADELPF